MEKISLRAKLGFASIAGAVMGVISTVAAHADTVVPTVSTSDIADVGGPILGSLITGTKYVLVTFGPPLFLLLLAVGVFFMIYHKARYGTWL